MRRRRTAEEVARLLREADRDLAKGLTVSDICRKVGIAETTYYRWRQQYDPEKVDADRRGRRGWCQTLFLVLTRCLQNQKQSLTPRTARINNMLTDHTGNLLLREFSPG